ncbi:hypothetical protein CHUAL_000499 [Chamberlinius hualienensis]
MNDVSGRKFHGITRQASIKFLCRIKRLTLRVLYAKLELQNKFLAVGLFRRRWRTYHRRYRIFLETTHMSTNQRSQPKAVIYQGELPPPLPVPPLAQTLQRYLYAVKAVVSPKRYETTEKIVQKFGEAGGEGEFLQNKIVEIASSLDNWVYEWWLQDMYLKNRLPLPINSNPGMVFPSNLYKGVDELIRIATHFVNGILDFKYKLDRQALPLDKIKDQPLCMAQYYRLLTSCRIPLPEKDEQLSTIGRRDEHITVAYKKRFYIIPVIINEERVAENAIKDALKRVVQFGGQQNDEGDLIGILTADHRDRWANARSLLMKDKINSDALHKIQTSLFVICIDDPLPLSFNQRYNPDVTRKRIRNDVNKAMQMLYGGGSKFNSANRWFDQTLQIILSTDGTCGLCYEHSPAEGVVVIQLMEQLIMDFQKGAIRQFRDDQQVVTDAVVNPMKITWKISSEVNEAINTAIHSLDKLGEDLNFYVLRFREYGKDYPKANNASPDAFIQLALQLTFFKVHRKLVSTYESASTRRFRLGRVDNIRAATPEALKWVKAMCGDNDITDSEKLSYFREALTVQTEIMSYNVNGQGIDCHLLGLKEIAQQLGRPTPEIFTDDVFKTSIYFALSTSQVSTMTDSFMGYGPVVPNGYGVSYNLQPDKIIFCVSSFFSDDDTNSEMFAMSLESTLLQMSELLEKSRIPQAVAVDG